jgi:hypothetical protein
MLFLHILFLKWQFWGNRLLLPCALFVCPVLVAMTGAWRYRSLRGTAGILMLLQTIFVLAFSLNRPLVPLPASWRYTGAVPLFSASRSERFYTGYNAEARPACQQLVSLVREHNWHSIGLVVDDNYPEYVLWRAMHDAGFDNVEFHHINAELPPNYHGAPWPPKVDGYLKVPGLAKP